MFKNEIPNSNAQLQKYIFHQFWNSFLAPYIDPAEYLTFLKLNGFSKAYLNGEKSFVRISGNIVKVVSIDDIQNFTTKFIRDTIPETPFLNDRNHPVWENHQKRVLNIFFGKHRNLIDEKFLCNMEVIEISLPKDTPAAAIFNFQNGFVSVSKENIAFSNWEADNSFVWEHTLSPCSFYTDESEGDFESFINKVTDNNLQRKKSLSSIIGYSLHDYYTNSTRVAFILTDDNPSLGNQGRTGKGVIVSAIKQVRSTRIIDGKSFNPQNQFAYSAVEASDRIICFDDVDKSLHFDKLYNVINGDYTIEKKYKNSVTVKKENSAKVIITANNGFFVSGESDFDRLFVFALYPAYNSKHKPFHDFKHEFFSSEWSQKQWNQFHTFMFRCVQLYLKEGIIRYDFPNYKKKCVSLLGSPELTDFLQEQSWENPIPCNHLYESFIKEYPEENLISMKKFGSCVRAFANSFGYEFQEKCKVNKKRCYYLKKTK